MATLNHKQLQLVVDGYIREQESTLNLSTIVPISINSIIYDYGLYSETWNKKHSNTKAVIDDIGLCAEIFPSQKFGANTTIYGDYIIKKGDILTWNLTIVKAINCSFLIGLVPNNEIILKKYQSDYFWHQGGGYVWCAFAGQFGYDTKVKENYSENLYGNTGDVMKMILNINESTIHFVYNDKDYGNALAEIDHKIKNDDDTEFRFALCTQGRSGIKVNITFDDCHLSNTIQ
eukprot:333737_1